MWDVGLKFGLLGNWGTEGLRDCGLVVVCFVRGYSMGVSCEDAV